MQAIHQWQEERTARVFHAARAHSETGPVDQGRWPDDILRYCKDRGMPLSGAESRYKISVYAFASKASPQEWEDSIKAAIVAGRPVPICYLLPSNYGAESSGEMTSGYHETLIVAFRPGAFLMLNSWGQGWGRQGFGWVPIPFLLQAGWQNGHVIAHSGVFDERTAPTPDPPTPNPPTPTPITTYSVSGEAKGGGLEFLKTGQVLQAGNGQGFSGTIGPISLTSITPQPQPQPPDPPDPTGDLKVEATPNGTGWWSFRAVDGERYVSAKIELLGQTKLTQVYGVNRAIAATFWLGHKRGESVEVIARALQGGKAGVRTIVA
jgi:hypothetical protein